METGLYDRDGKSLKLNDTIKIYPYTFDTIHGSYIKYKIVTIGNIFILKYVESDKGIIKNQVDCYLTDYFKEGLLNGTFESEIVELCEE